MRFARIVSYVFHPVLMPLLGILVIFNSGIYAAEIPFQFKRFVYALVILCYIALPLAFLSALYLFKIVSRITLDQRQERILPLVLTTLSFYLGYYLLSRYSPIKLVNVFLFASVMVVLASLLVSLFWKISLHTTGTGGLVGLLLSLSFIYSADLMLYLSIALVIAGIVGTSRMALRTHSLSQVAGGFILGISVVLTLMLIFLR